MNDYQENIFSMCLRVEARLDNNLTIVNTLAALATARTAFKTRIANIRATDLIATTPTTGVTQDKTAIRQTVVTACIQQSSALCAFATNNGNNTLYDEVYKSESDIGRLRDDQLPIYATLIAQRQTDNLAGLADYGVTAASITAFENLIALYTAASPTPRSAINTRKTAKANVKDQIKDISDFLKKVMDKLVLTFNTAEPDFVQQYFNDRNILDEGSGSGEGPSVPPTSIVLHGKVTDSVTGSPIPNAQVNVLLPQEPGPITTFTNPTGDYFLQFDDLVIGQQADFTVSAVMSGYSNGNSVIHVTVGNAYTVNFALVPV